MNASTRRFPLVAAIAAGVLGIGLYFFPLFHVVPVAPAGGTGGAAPAPATPAAFDPIATAARIWKTDLPAAAQRAPELKEILAAVRENPVTARERFAKAAGLGAAYYFARGTGRVVARERNFIRLAIDGNELQLVALRIGPVFGNTVRDGCGLLEVNAFPGVQEFNALSAELNTLVEKTLLPVLRERAVVGATVVFTACAEAPDSAPEPGEPLLMLVPVQAEVR